MPHLGVTWEFSSHAHRWHKSNYIFLSILKKILFITYLIGISICPLPPRATLYFIDCSWISLSKRVKSRIYQPASVAMKLGEGQYASVGNPVNLYVKSIMAIKDKLISRSWSIWQHYSNCSMLRQTLLLLRWSKSTIISFLRILK